MTLGRDNDKQGPAWISADQLRRALPIKAAADALEDALRAGSLPTTPKRLSINHEGGQCLTMPAAGPMGVGAKLVTVQPRNPELGLPLVHSVYAVFTPENMVPAAVVEGGELTRLRTAAVSALATRHLARRGAASLLIFGTGVQACAHIEAMRAERPIDRVVVVGRTPEAADELVSALAADGVEARSGTADDVAKADLICACTTAGEPLFDGDLLGPGAHVNAIGSFQPSTREVDGRALERSRVILEDRAAVIEEAGDLRIPLEEGAIAEGDIAGELVDVVRGDVARESDQEITLFKSVGLAWEDLVVVGAALGRLGLA